MCCRPPSRRREAARAGPSGKVGALQRRLARHAPATALATCMHQYWVGTAAQLCDAGDPSLEWILDEVANGTIFASGHAEAGNDVPIALSTTRAERVDGGWLLNGRKHFGSLGPAWDYLGLHAMADGEDGPVVVHGFVRRSDTGVDVQGEWDAIGMRASQSFDTVLTDVFLPDERTARVVPAGDMSDPFLGIMQIWAVTLIANAYLGAAERAAEIAFASAAEKRSVAVPGGTLDRNPFVQHLLADNFLDLHAAGAVLDGVMLDWEDGVDHGPTWPARVFSAKWHVARTAKRVVDRAMEVVGGSSFARTSELGRLYRDIAGAPFHPASDAFTHEVVAKTVLGIAPSEPRW